MKYTLLDLVQRILESMESDEVSSINETPESISVANIVKECYFDIVGKLGSPETRGLFKFDASGDGAKPALLLVPNTVSRVEWVRYRDLEDADIRWKDIRFVDNEEFLYYQEGFSPSDGNVVTQTVTFNGKPWTFYLYNDRTPEYYTIFDEQFVVFDAFDGDEEATLTEAHSMGFGELIPAWSFTDSFVPDLDARQFQLLLQDAKSTAHIEHKQAPNPKAEAKARSNHILAQKQKNDNDPYSSVQTHYRYGRKGPGQRRDVMISAMRRGR